MLIIKNSKLKDVLPKDAYKIYRILDKQIKKNKKELLKICKEYVETENSDLLVDMEYYSQELFDDMQNKSLIQITSGLDDTFFVVF